MDIVKFLGNVEVPNPLSSAFLLYNANKLYYQIGLYVYRSIMIWFKFNANKVEHSYVRHN